MDKEVNRIIASYIIMKEYSMPYIKHLEELRIRIMYSILSFLIIAILIYVKAEIFINFILSIFKSAIESKQDIFFAREIFDGFLTRIKLSVYIAIIFSMPVFVYNILRFIFPAISKKIRSVIIIAIIVSFVISILSSYFSLKYLIPFAIKTLTSKNFIPSSVNILLDYNTQAIFPISLTLWILVVFQIPVILSVLMYLNIIKRTMVITMIRPLIVAIFILAAIITPPDVITQIFIALPLIVLLLLSILLSYIFKFGE